MTFAAYVPKLDDVQIESGWIFHQGGDPTPTPWLIKHILPEIGASLISGQWGTYKTTVALDMAVNVMTSTPFAGRFRVKKSGGVAYFALEGSTGINSRLTTIARNGGYDEPLPFIFQAQCPPLTSADALDKLIALVGQGRDELRNKFDVPLVLVFIDTMIAAASYEHSGDDNDAAMAQRVIAVLEQLAQREGIQVVGIDHFGKVVDTGTRGSSAKEGHANTVLALLADRETDGTLSNTRMAIRKQRDGVSGLTLPFTPTSVRIGVDEDGDPLTSVVIDWDTSRPGAEGKVSEALRPLKRILTNMLLDTGKDIRPFIDGPQVRACDIELVRAEFYRQHPADGDEKARAETRRKAFGRAIKKANATGLTVSREINGTQFIWFG